ncbi:transcriptional regulator [Allopusillimonas soli]|uniref:Transcriptional regulator n=1 Tax=Allopusillimonas soli TaxID=659016 RepID=A0A853FH75_9BURK|nr:PhaM family polyhydroxyalkanoate granule multifunctional regulatory protein [Allopusillimonas soli]NYT37336.1 transcriptional regulator [Allopusillimonas soli]TEA74680.1 transcriptional regulator [Allopusillimonas soli]
MSQNKNPFVLPGLGQDGDMASNPVMASMEMMRQAWENLAGAGRFDAGLAVPCSPEDLDRRIKDLRAVENWLRMNLSMLTSTIQGLEVQRATLATLKGFMGGAMPQENVTAAAGSSGPDRASGRGGPSGRTKAEASQDAGSQGTAPGSADAYTAQAIAASEGWWDMVQKQFDTLAAATAASLQGAQAQPSEAGDGGGDPDGDAPAAAPKPRRAAKRAGVRKTTARRAASSRKN